MNPTAEKLSAQAEELRRRLDNLQQEMQRLAVDFCKHHEEVTQFVQQQKKSARLRPVTNPERRTAKRRKGNPISVQLQCTNGAAGQEAFQGWVVDRSAGGLRLLVDDPLSPGTLLHVRPAKAPLSYPWIEVRVKNCFSERKSWNVGCEFLKRVSWDDLQQFG